MFKCPLGKWGIIWVIFVTESLHLKNCFMFLLLFLRFSLLRVSSLFDSLDWIPFWRGWLPGLNEGHLDMAILTCLRTVAGHQARSEIICCVEILQATHVTRHSAVWIVRNCFQFRIIDIVIPSGDLNLGPKRLSLHEFETWQLRPLGHHGRFLFHLNSHFLMGGEGNLNPPYLFFGTTLQMKPGNIHFLWKTLLFAQSSFIEVNVTKLVIHSFCKFGISCH